MHSGTRSKPGARLRQSASQAAQNLKITGSLVGNRVLEVSAQDQAGRFQGKRDTIAISSQAMKSWLNPCRHSRRPGKEAKISYKAEKARKLG